MGQSSVVIYGLNVVCIFSHADNMNIYVENPEKPVKTLEIIDEFSKVS